MAYDGRADSRVAKHLTIRLVVRAGEAESLAGSLGRGGTSLVTSNRDEHAQYLQVEP